MNIFKIKILEVKSIFYKRKLIKNLSPIDINDTHLTESQYTIVTLKKDIIVYKKALKNRLSYTVKDEVLITLLIPKGTKVFITKDKCRAEKAIVLSIKNNNHYLKQAVSIYNTYFKYNINNTIRPDFFEEYNKRCGHGIHFFLKKKDAKNY